MVLFYGLIVDRALARANLRMGLVDLRLVAARNIPLGRFAAARDRHIRKSHLQHELFSRC